MSDNIRIRKYEESDCEEIYNLFYYTVHTVNAVDYSEEQLDVWAVKDADLTEWRKSFLIHQTFVAVFDEKIVGFGDIDDSGYLDRLYVHKDYQRRGIATALCNVLENAVDSAEIETHASITAKPFFLKRGYEVVRENRVNRKSIILTNYIMRKKL